MRRSLARVFVLACLSLLGCEFFPESTFELSPESRLPKWFALPPGVTRAEVTVTMSYYVKLSGRTATFTLSGSKIVTTTKVSGTQKGLKPIELKNPPLGYPPHYPSYEIITVNSVTEVIEHRKMEPIFYVTDDPTVLAELGISRAN